jgi:hypothetical protein
MTPVREAFTPEIIEDGNFRAKPDRTGFQNSSVMDWP